MRRTLFICPWCTLGGVERSILNRAMALKDAGLHEKFVVHFVHGGSDQKFFKSAIGALSLADRIEVRDHGLSDFDRFVMVDCTDGWPLVPEGANVFVECHTTYPESQQYLRDLPSSVRAVIGPSEKFVAQIMPLVRPGIPVRSVINYVPPGAAPRGVSTVSAAPLFFHYGRMDYWKNDAEVFAIFAQVAKEEPRARFLICGDILSEERYFRYLDNAGLIGRSEIVPSISFEHMGPFLERMASRKAVFVSASRGESFGLAAAETMSYGIPVVLSDVGGHRSLVYAREEFLYPLHDVRAGAAKLLAVHESWQSFSQVAQSIAATYADAERVSQQWHAAMS